MTQCVQAGKLVCLQYTLSLVDGTPVDSSSESGTWTYVHGHTRMPAGLVKGVEGLSAGDQVRLTLAPEDAFGPADPEAFQQLPKERFPASTLYVGYSGEVPGPGQYHHVSYSYHQMILSLQSQPSIAGEHVVFDVTVVHVQD